MPETLVWWVMAQVVGLAALPLCLTLFRRLPDRGYALSKPFALLLLGYLFWILNVIGVFPNTTGAIWLSLFLIAACSGFLLWRRRDELLSFARERWWLIVTVEVVFFLTFVTAAYLRSYVGDLGGTEKPMDFMFLNAVTRAKDFPPPDPWLSGHSVSYYYFGYLLASIMTRLSGLETGVGFNLGLSMIVALAVTGAFGIVYNMAAPTDARAATEGPGAAPAGFSMRPLWRPMIFGLSAGLLLAVMGNLEGLFEWIAAHHIGSAGFWSWLHIYPQDQLQAYNSTKWYPDQHWFWWRATRVLDGGVGIHEMPFFSFLLGDLHPHVMSIPFVLLALGASLALLRSEEPLDVVVWLERPFALVAYGLIIGALAFLNTWDMPTAVFVLTLMVLIRNRLLSERWSWSLALDSAGFIMPLLVVALLAYSPFFFGGFSSQASGFTAEHGGGTRLFDALLLWSPFAVLVLPYAAWRLSQNGGWPTWRQAAWAFSPLVAIFLLWVVWDVLGGDPGNPNADLRGGHLLSWLPNAMVPNDARAGFGDRLAARDWSWLTVLALGGTVAVLALALWREVEAAKRAAEERLGHVFALALSMTAALLILGVEFFYIEDGFDSRMNTIFKLYYQSWLLLSIAGGFALSELTRGLRMPSLRAVSTPSFSATLGNWGVGEVLALAATVFGAILGVVLMKDTVFGLRLLGAAIGGGLLFAVAATSVLLWRMADEEAQPRALTWRGLWASGAAVILLSAFVYPLLASYNRTNGFDGPRTVLDRLKHLDGPLNGHLDGLSYYDPNEQAVIAWLNGRDGEPVVAEAPGDDYSDAGRISAATGLPTILQWPGHEGQWRNGNLQAGRPEDLEQLYTSSDAAALEAIIQKYGISYVIVGRTEREKYANLTVPQMTEVFESAYEQGDVAVYRIRPGILSAVASN